MAVRLPRGARGDIVRAAGGLRALACVRPVRVEQLHLTLRFIGEVDRSLETPLAREIGVALADLPRFPMRLRAAGVFPSVKRPRVVWIGVAETPALTTAQRLAEEAVVRCGVAADSRRFHPHVTVGRIRGAPSTVDLADAIAGTRFDATVLVRHVSLMRSEFLPDGTRHAEVAVCPLAGGHQGH